MKVREPYYSPAWTKQRSLAEFARRLCLPLDTKAKIDAYLWVTDLIARMQGLSTSPDPFDYPK